jgi:hypothetical protein
VSLIRLFLLVLAQDEVLVTNTLMLAGAAYQSATRVFPRENGLSFHPDSHTQRFDLEMKRSGCAAFVCMTYDIHTQPACP